ncbi:PDR/VanB family oxidoreductase [Catenulispora pinisilvae]|uniref:PDR/VanB family oxidoreductase n=1 Tax=Catenulispora pinisilvae TaxID=2705253 RepID=UPI002B269498|nr:PDR/VanB family oxidoreductase [Catenulispora pinisilvae]
MTVATSPSALYAARTDPGPLRVTQVSYEADRVISIRLEHPEGRELSAWSPGAHLDLQLPSGLIRQYSLCGDPTDRTSYTFAVLLEEDGRGGSAELHSLPLVGRTLTVRALRNHFQLGDSPSYLLVAGGIGVTPMIPMVRRLAAGSAPWSLLYLGRTRTGMAFSRELRALGGRSVQIFPRDEVDRLDIDAAIAATGPDTAVYCCGPDALMNAVAEACASVVPPRALHTERFAAGSTPTPDQPTSVRERTGFTVTLRRSGAELVVPPDRSILDVVRDVMPDVSYSCEEGYCGSCETRVLSGIPDHADDILTPQEREANDTMMICVSRSRADNIVLDL